MEIKHSLSCVSDSQMYERALNMIKEWYDLTEFWIQLQITLNWSLNDCQKNLHDGGLTAY